MTVSQWADKYRILNEIESPNFPGPWRTARTPYLRQIMDAFNDPGIEEIIVCSASRVGKTQCILNPLGYIIHQDPGPALIVYPDLELAEFTSENRVGPFVLSSPALADRYNKRTSDKLELQFQNMYLVLVGANSAAGLSARTIRYVFFDEIDKYPKWTGKEANPLSLGEERAKGLFNKKIVKVSTPTLTMGPIWQAWEKADLRLRYQLPCPHCGHFQVLTFGQIKFPKDETLDNRLRASAAYYECKHCQGIIDDRQKQDALDRDLGKWAVVPKTKRAGVLAVEDAPPVDDGPRGRVKSVAFHLSSLYSRWITWADIVEEWLKSQDTPELLMNFINSWLGEPWEDKASRMRSDVVMEMAAGHDRGRVPDEALLLTCGVDVQKGHFWWTVRAWGEGLTSWLVDYGRVEAWDEVDTIIEREYVSVSDELHRIQLACIDSGDGTRTEEVYEYCSGRLGYCIPTKGASHQMRARYQVTKIEKGPSMGLLLYVLDTGQFKDFIAGRLGRKKDGKFLPGAWMICQGVERLYADQICSEQKVPVRNQKGKLLYEEWQPISSHAANHLLDAEVGAAAAAEILQLRYLHKPKAPEEKADKGDQAGRWMPRREGWLRRR